jgi:hypothetical protein
MTSPLLMGGDSDSEKRRLPLYPTIRFVSWEWLTVRINHVSGDMKPTLR